MALNKSGFTLIEGLVVIVVISILMAIAAPGWLALLERQRLTTAHYMSDDLKEAVYVYSDGTELDRIVTELDDLQAKVTTDGAVPILAFWRPIYHDADEVGSSGGACAANSDTCTLLKTRGATYSLVVYYLLPPTGTVQEGKSHIRRYELSEYSDITTLTATTNYVSPITTENGTQFESWEAGGTVSATTDNALVDYVGSINNGAVANTTLCANYTDTPLTDLDTAYNLLPSTATTDSSFFACVRDSTPDELSEIGSAEATAAAGLGTTAFRSRQDVYLFLRGDVEPDGATVTFFQPAGEGSRLPIIQTQVLLGGVIDEDSID